MQVGSAFLCDFASVRDGLLFVVAGGVTRIWRSDFPAPLGVSLAIVIELHRMERGRPHELEVRLQDDDGAMVAEIKGGFQVPHDETLPIHEPTYIPMTFDLRPVGVEHPGSYSVEISIDGTHHRTLTFQVGAPGQSPTEAPGGPG